MSESAFGDAIRRCMPSEEEMLTMAAEGIWPPPSILDPPEMQQVVWNGLATVRGILEGTPVEDWPKVFPSAYEEERDA
jgi:hypothetical protein